MNQSSVNQINDKKPIRTGLSNLEVIDNEEVRNLSDHNLILAEFNGK